MLFLLRQTNFSSFWKLFVFPLFHFYLVFPHFWHFSIDFPKCFCQHLAIPGQTWSGQTWSGQTSVAILAQAILAQAISLKQHIAFACVEVVFSVRVEDG